MYADDWLSGTEQRELDGALAMLASEVEDEILLVVPAVWDDQQGVVAVTPSDIWFCSPDGPWKVPLAAIRALEPEVAGVALPSS